MKPWEIHKKFEVCWNVFVKGYPTLRRRDAFRCEADVQLHFAALLREELGRRRSHWVHQETLIYPNDAYSGRGRPLSAKKRVDIAIANGWEIPYLIAEIKWLGLWDERDIGRYYKTKEEHYEQWKRKHESRCQGRLTKAHQLYYLEDLNSPQHYLCEYVERLEISGFICVIDEWNENIDSELDRLLRDRPRRLKILAKYIPYHKLCK